MYEWGVYDAIQPNIGLNVYKTTYLCVKALFSA